MGWAITGTEDEELWRDLAQAFAKHWERRTVKMADIIATPYMTAPAAISGKFNIHMTAEDGRLLEFGDAALFFDYRGEK